MNERSTKTKRILLVDDDPNICRFISESLRLRGFDVDCFTSAEQSLETLEQSEYDLALLDILLPGDNGLQLCKRIRALPGKQTLPVVMMTAFYRQADQIREAREQYGATDYLLKPFPLQTLHAKIDQLLGPQEQKQEAGRIDINGSLQETPLPRILHNLYSLRATGLLHIERGDLKKVIYIKNGYPIFVRSNLIREFLGQRLVKSGMISAEQLEDSLAKAKESGQKHGTALISMGLLTPHQLNDALHQQVIEKLLDIFSWLEGDYRFVQAREFKQGVTSILLSPANLILQGLKEHTGQEQVTALLTPYLERYPLMAENPLYRFQEIQLLPYDHRILKQCNGESTVTEILQRHQLSRKKVEPLLAALLTTGILDGRPEPCPAGEESPCEEASLLREQREAFLKEYTWMMQQDFFSLLGQNETASRDNIRKAYYGLVKKYHPDRFFEQEMLTDVKEQVNVLFQRINEAHETLIDPIRREQYLKELRGTKTKKADLDILLEAEAAFHRGMALFRKKNFGAALAEFEQAVEHAPLEAEYLTYQAWTSVKNAPDDQGCAEQAKQALLKSVQMNPRIAVTHLYLGYLLQKEGNEKAALRRFERAIQYNPSCTDALRELRLHQMRNKENEKSTKHGFFRKPKT